MTKFTASEPAPGRSDSVKILRLLWEMLLPFLLARLTPKQQARPALAHTHLPPLGPETSVSRPDVTPAENKAPLAVNVVAVLESPSESQAGNVPGDGMAA
jgi:hypothetical protein